MHLIDTSKVKPREPAGHFGGLTVVDVVDSVCARHLTVQISHNPVGSGGEMHSHEQSEQLFYVLQGELTVSTASGQSATLKPGMGVLFAPREAHATVNQGTEEVVAIVITSPQS